MARKIRSDIKIGNLEKKLGIPVYHLGILMAAICEVINLEKNWKK